MKTDEIRARFLDFFKKRGHTVVKSDSLVPQNDPTLLFTGAGMNQFKEYFLGIKKDLRRAASCQKCLRTGDLDEVGRTPYHHSFFEMLGNFSFGDYFKREAIQMGWEFLTVDLRLPRERLRVSVHHKDNEAFSIWRDEIKVPTAWIYKMGDESNFWPSNAPLDGPNGPSGPCSEIYFDQRPDSKTEEIESRRFAEIWNLVFTQYDRQEGGKLVPLGQKNIDTGMGLERLACVMQKKNTNFETDLFIPLNEAVRHSLKTKSESDFHLYAISDHARAVTFAITDGVIPSNDGRGYVIRKLIRRALWRAHQLLHSPETESTRTLEKPFLFEVASEVIRTMKKAYPELAEAEYNVKQTIRTEEERFLKTLETGLALLDEKIESARQKGQRSLSGGEVFRLYDTYGFPDELTRNIAEKNGLEIDQREFDRLMEAQRKKAKEASPIASGIFVTSEAEKAIASLPATKFLGYQTLESKGKVLWADFAGGKGSVVLDETPFYPEGGGQVGDQGRLESPSFRGRVTDTQKKGKCVVHSVEVEKGNLEAGERVEARVDRSRREAAMRNHTATHLLHSALRQVLGQQVRQLGSLVNPEKVRFDYSFGQALSENQIREIEDLVNREILKDTAVSKEEKSLEEAQREGALAFFGEKYGHRVRVATIPGFSKELCGGTHCDRTGQIGSFVIVNDASIGSGIRRMEALTGLGALDDARNLRNQLSQLAQSLKTTPQEVVARVSKIQESLRKIEKGQGGLSDRALKPGMVEEVLAGAGPAGKLRFATYRGKEMSLDSLRLFSDHLRVKGKETVYLLAAQGNEKIYYLLGMTEDLRKGPLDLNPLFNHLAGPLEASGGGRKDLVQGGGTNPQVLEERNWSQVTRAAVEYLTHQVKTA